MAATFKDLLPSSSSTQVTFTLTSLASSTGRTAGAQSNLYTNQINLDLVLQLGGKIKMGTSAATAGKQIDIWVIPAYQITGGTPTFPDVFTGAGTATKTATSANVLQGCGYIVKSIIFDTTANQTYYFAGVDLGEPPSDFVLFVSHDAGVALSATGTDHEFWITRKQRQSV